MVEVERGLSDIATKDKGKVERDGTAKLWKGMSEKVEEHIPLSMLLQNLCLIRRELLAKF